MRFDAHDGHVRFIAAELFQEQMRREFAWTHFARAQPPLLTREKTEVVEPADKFVMVGIAQRLLEALSHLALETFWHRGCSARGMEGDHGTEATHAKFFRFGKRLDLDQLASLEHASRFHVFVDETFDREDQLVFKWRPRRLWQSTHIQLEGVNRRLMLAFDRLRGPRLLGLFST